MSNETIKISNENGEWETLATKKWRKRKTYTPNIPGEIRAAMPGTIVSIEAECKEKATIKAGTPLLVLEAMKMHNTISAPISGLITKVCASTGERVSKGALLVEISPN